MAIMVRADRDAAGLEAEVRKVMREVAPELPIYSLATMSSRFNSLISPQRLASLMLGSFAALALLLAALGLYGVVSYQVSQRTREIGLRLALGAPREAVLMLILGRVLRMTGLGVVLGLAGALATTRLLSSLLYNTAPTDVLTFIAVAILLTTVALLACWVPARRATLVDPNTALRAE